MVVPFEEQAYQMDARYTSNPAEFFSVDEEVREWLRSGRSKKGKKQHFRDGNVPTSSS
jgi:hypothetical protein